MTVKLNNRAFDHAKSLIRDGKYVIDDRDAWSEHQPSTRQDNESSNGAATPITPNGISA